MAIGRKEVARAALQSVSSLHPDFHDKILAALDGVGLLDKPNVQSVHAAGGSMSAAASEARKAAMRLAAGELRRAGLDLTGTPISIHTINSALAAKNISPEKRVQIKTILAAAGCIE